MERGLEQSSKQIAGGISIAYGRSIRANASYFQVSEELRRNAQCDVERVSKSAADRTVYGTSLEQSLRTRVPWTVQSAVFLATICSEASDCVKSKVPILIDTKILRCVRPEPIYIHGAIKIRPIYCRRPCSSDELARRLA